MGLNGKLTGQILSCLETPCLIIDVEQVKKNIEEMQQAVTDVGCALRPHIKTHKMGLFAQMQVQAGAQGITCAKVSEAECMADAGIQDIFIAYPLIGAFRIKRAAKLAERVQRLILAVESLPGAVALSEYASQAGISFEVRLEIDTGAGRTGVPMPDAPNLAVQIHSLPGLRLTGIYTFKSLMYQGKPTQDNALAAEEEGRMMAETAQAIEACGIKLQDISAGSSPTGVQVARTGQVTEVRPGTYIFKDAMLVEEKVAAVQDLAVKFVATVVSCHHAGYAVIDGGTKTFPTDIPLNVSPGFYPGYALVDGMPHLRLSRMNEEHGIITSTTGETGLHVGQQLVLTPIHVCTAINMQNTVYLLENGELTQHRVEARGMLV